MFCSHASSGRKLAPCSNPAIMCTLYDFSGGLCLWKAVFSSSPALFPLIVILAKAGCWFKWLYRCNGGFSWPSLQLEAEQSQRQPCQPASHERFRGAGAAGGSRGQGWALLRSITLPKSLLQISNPQQGTAGTVQLLHTTVWLGKEIGKKCWKPEHFYHFLCEVLLPLSEIIKFLLNQGAAATSDIH